MISEQNLQFRKATETDIPHIWKILQQSIERRKNDGSNQWQDGYPNLSTVENDVAKDYNYVLLQNETLIGTAALIFNNEPTYENIDGAWVTNGDFLVVHRLGLSDEVIGKGFATKFFQVFEGFAKENKVYSIKVDTNFDNLAMLKILEKLGYTYCGEIKVRDGKRKAFEKILK